MHMAFKDVCRADEIAIGAMKAVTVEATRLIVYRLTDGYYATQASCTHLFAPLVRGKVLDDCRIQCPFHHARFDIRTGAVVDWANFPPGVQLLNAIRGRKALQTFRTRVANGSVQVDL
jgi:3-phenylpropionate/trans-cinnamate dioxygenase ferredoxin subunit